MSVENFLHKVGKCPVFSASGSVSDIEVRAVNACLGASPMNVRPRVSHHQLVRHRVGQGHTRGVRPRA